MIGVVFIAVVAAGAVLVALAALVELLPPRLGLGPDEPDRQNECRPSLDQLHSARMSWKSK